MIPESFILELENEKVHISQEKTGLSVIVETKYEVSHNQYQMVWKEYLSHVQGDRVLRGGSGLNGIYPYDKDYPFMDCYPESINTHHLGCVILANAIFSMPFNAFSTREKNQILTFLACHDRGETETGDIPDDGTKGAVHSDIDQIELNDFVRNISHFPVRIQEQLITNYCLFDGLAPMRLSNSDAKLAQFEKLCDKFESLLRSLVFEREGRGGDLMTKKEVTGSLSESDQKYIDLIGTSSQMDVWYASILMKYHTFDFLPIFVQILDEAVFDVRSEPLPWVEKFCNACDIDYQSLYSNVVCC